MGSETSFDIWIIGISLVIVLSSYLLICFADRSWLNWATPGYLITFGAIFLFPVLSLFSAGPIGSRFAYIFCYTTYGLTNLCMAIAYTLTRRIPSPGDPARFQPSAIGVLPWLLLAVGILLYMPILIKFSALLLHPRDIYALTRSGYGPLTFGSRAFLSLAFVTYLFKRQKSVIGSLVFFSLCLLFIFLHGSKAVLVNLLSMAMVFQVYVKGRRMGFARAASIMLVFVVFAMSVFALFANLTDVSEIITYVQGYSDYTKNAMIVIDDPARQSSWGRLTLEGEIYARVPRFLYPAKPSNFGAFKLAQDYYPAWHRADSGDPDFNIGVQYADFGPLAIVYLCITYTLTGAMAGFVVRALSRKPSAPLFILLLFFSGFAIVSFGSGYALPESLLIAFGIWLLTRTSNPPIPTLQPSAPLQ
jgi:hypothetical protein